MNKKKRIIWSMAATVTAICVALLLLFPAGGWDHIRHLYLQAVHQPDENGMYMVGDHAFKALYPLDERSVEKMTQKLESLYDTYLNEEMRVFYSIVPDKAYFAQDSGYPVLDYDRMISILQQSENLENMEYIDIFDTLTLDDYYKTDGHWRQEALFDTVNKLGEAMGFSVDPADFTENRYTPFYGTYAEDIPGKVPEEDLVYLTSADTQAAVVYNYETDAEGPVYALEKLQTDVMYDVYLSGATPLMVITNPEAETERELLVFRDSYASSLVPLLTGCYSKITLIDLRYMVNTLLPEYIEFTDQDVLFLYSTGVVNNSTMLR